MRCLGASPLATPLDAYIVTVKYVPNILIIVFEHDYS